MTYMKDLNVNETHILPYYLHVSLLSLYEFVYQESIKKRSEAQIMEGASFWTIVIPSGGARVLPEHKLKQEPNSSDLFVL